MSTLSSLINRVSELSTAIGNALQLRGFKEGGTTGQVPVKSSDDDFDWEWQDVVGGGGVSNGDKGDITVAGSTWTINNGVVTLAKQANIATSSLIGRYTAGTGVPQVITIGGGLALSGSSLVRAALTGDATASAGSNTLTLSNTGAVAGSYTNANITVDAKGRILDIENGEGFEAVTAGPGVFIEPDNEILLNEHKDWTLRDIPNLFALWTAEDSAKGATGLPVIDGEVYSLVDIVNGITLTPPSAGFRPSRDSDGGPGGIPCLTFIEDALKTTVDFATLEDFTVVYLGKQRSTGHFSGERIFESDGTPTFNYVRNSLGTSRAYSAGGGTTGTLTAVSDAWTLDIIEHINGSGRASKNDWQERNWSTPPTGGSISNFSIGAWSLGANYCIDQDIIEIAIIEGPLSDETSNRLREYAAEKLGLTYSNQYDFEDTFTRADSTDLGVGETNHKWEGDTGASGILDGTYTIVSPWTTTYAWAQINFAPGSFGWDYTSRNEGGSIREVGAVLITKNRQDLNDMVHLVWGFENWRVERFYPAGGSPVVAGSRSLTGSGGYVTSGSYSVRVDWEAGLIYVTDPDDVETVVDWNGNIATDLIDYRTPYLCYEVGVVNPSGAKQDIIQYARCWAIADDPEPKNSVSDGDKGDITVSNRGRTWTINSPIAPEKLGTGSSITTKFLRGDGTWQTISGGGDALTTNPLSQFAATTSAQLAGVISDETGSGALVFAQSPTLVTPALGTPSSGTLTNCTGTASGLTAGAVSDIGNLTGVVTSTNRATAIADGALSIAKTSGLQTALDGKLTSADVDTANTPSKIVARDGAGVINVGLMNATGGQSVFASTQTTGVTEYGNSATWTYGTGRAAVHREALQVFETIGIACSDMTTVLTTGEKIAFDMPFAFSVRRVYASLAVAPTVSALTLDVEDEGTSILNAVLSISTSANNAETSTFASAASSYALSKGDRVTVDIDSVGSSNAGLIVFLEGYRTA